MVSQESIRDSNPSTRRADSNRDVGLHEASSRIESHRGCSLPVLTVEMAGLAAILALAISGCSSQTAGSAVPLRVGYQKWGTCSILKASGRLEAALKGSRHPVEWVEFPSGPPLLEALNAGSIDVGHAGDSPPLFAQAAGVPFVYIAASSPSPQSSALLVRTNDSLKEIEDLRGKRLGVTKGTSGHTLVVRLLEQHGLSLSDVELIYLTPADARVALAAESIDAWSTWDPYLSAAEHAGTARRIADGRGIVSGREFYFASQSIVKSQPELIRTFLKELTDAKDWAKDHPDDVTQLLSKQTGLPTAAVQLAESRRNRYDTRPVSAELIAEQQALADRYWELGLLPRAIRVDEATDQTLGDFLK